MDHVVESPPSDWGRERENNRKKRPHPYAMESGRPAHEIRVTNDGKHSNYVAYGERMLKSHGLVVVSGGGKALVKAIGVCEALKRRFKQELHQRTGLASAAVEVKRALTVIPAHEGPEQEQQEARRVEVSRSTEKDAVFITLSVEPLV
jgi:DNA-binding protein